ncbi:MAG: hypothetical protein RLZZ267_1345 [Bacillota bacterium]|jgi:cytoskeletal protein RodZ
MSELGSFLKKTREKQHLTLDQVQEITKIRKSYLQAIESGEFDQLPGHFYIRAFIKSYSESLGISFAELLQSFGSELSAYSPEPDEKPNTITRKEKMANIEMLAKLGSSVLLIAFIIFIIVLIYFFALSKEVEETENLDQTRITNEAKIYASPSPIPSPTPEPSKEPIEKSSSISETSVRVELVGKETNTLIYNVSNTDVININLSFTDDCWTLFRMQNNNGTVIKGELNKSIYIAGDTDTLESSKSIHLRFGNAKAISLEVNGIMIEDATLKEEGAKNIQLNLVKLNIQE